MSPNDPNSAADKSADRFASNFGTSDKSKDRFASNFGASGPETEAHSADSADAAAPLADAPLLSDPTVVPGTVEHSDDAGTPETEAHGAL